MAFVRYVNLLNREKVRGHSAHISTFDTSFEASLLGSIETLADKAIKLGLFLAIKPSIRRFIS